MGVWGAPLSFGLVVLPRALGCHLGGPGLQVLPTGLATNGHHQGASSSDTRARGLQGPSQRSFPRSRLTFRRKDRCSGSGRPPTCSSHRILVGFYLMDHSVLFAFLSRVMVTNLIHLMGVSRASSNFRARHSFQEKHSHFKGPQ